MKKFVTFLLVVILFFWMISLVFDPSAVQPVSQKNFVKKDYKYYINRIRKDRKWMKNIKEEAKINNISVDSMLSKKAKEWANKKTKESTKSTKTIKKDYDYYIKRIGEDENWMQSIKKEAEKLSLPVDTVLSRAAKEWSKNK